MAVSADLTQLAIVEEATPGVTPATPVFQVARITSESLAYNPTTQLSNELNPNRQVTDVIVSGGSSGGAIGMELSRNPTFETMLEGVFGNTWGATLADRLEVGPTLKTYTIEKRFAIDQAATVPVYDYHRIENAIMDDLTLTFAPGAADLGALTILGGHYGIDTSELAGATYVDAGTRPVMVGADALPVVFKIAGVSHLAWCMTQVVMAFKNNGRAIECLGTLGAAEMVIGRFEAEVTMDILVTDDTNVIMDAFLNRREDVAFALQASDSLTNSYWFEFDKCRIKTCTEVTPGTNQDVVLAVGLQALVSNAGAVPTVDTTCFILRAPTPPLDVPPGLETESQLKGSTLWQEMQELLPPGMSEEERRAVIAGSKAKPHREEELIPAPGITP